MVRPSGRTGVWEGYTAWPVSFQVFCRMVCPRSLASVVGCAVVLAVTAGCSGVSVVRSRQGRDVSGLGIAEAVRASTVVVPPLTTPRLLYREPGGAAYYAVGGVRVRDRSGDAVVGDQPFASTLVGAAPDVEGRWWFVTASGTVAWATDFVGPLHPVRNIGAPVVRAFGHEGQLVAVFADGRVRRVGPSEGSVSVNVLSSREAQPLVTSEEEASRVYDAAMTRFVSARLALPSTVLLASGDVAMRSGDYLYFMSIAQGGGLSVQGRVALVGEVAGACSLRSWGTRVLFVCPEVVSPARERTTPYVADIDGIEQVGPAESGAMFEGREGHTLTRQGPCSDPSRAAPGQSVGVSNTSSNTSNTVLCTLDRERGWREWEYPGTATLLDVYDSYALFAESREDNVVLRLYAIDAARSWEVPVSDPTVEIARAGFAHDGRIVVLAHAGPSRSRRSMVGVARPGTAVVLRPLGFFALDVAMADDRHGLAVGTTAGEIAVTHDGGFSWQPVRPMLDGDPATVTLNQERTEQRSVVPRRGERIERIGTLVQCSPVLCRAAGRLVHWWIEPPETFPAMEVRNELARVRGDSR